MEQSFSFELWKMYSSNRYALLYFKFYSVQRQHALTLLRMFLLQTLCKKLASTVIPVGIRQICLCLTDKLYKRIAFNEHEKRGKEIKRKMFVVH